MIRKPKSTAQTRTQRMCGVREPLVVTSLNWLIKCALCVYLNRSRGAHSFTENHECLFLFACIRVYVWVFDIVFFLLLLLLSLSMSLNFAVGLLKCHNSHTHAHRQRQHRQIVNARATVGLFLRICVWVWFVAVLAIILARSVSFSRSLCVIVVDSGFICSLARVFVREFVCVCARGV